MWYIASTYGHKLQICCSYNLCIHINGSYAVILGTGPEDKHPAGIEGGEVVEEGQSWRDQQQSLGQRAPRSWRRADARPAGISGRTPGWATMSPGCTGRGKL